MRRRNFIALLGGTAAAWPMEVRSQQPAMPVIGVISGVTPELYEDRLLAFRKGLSETGNFEGQTVAVEYHWTEGHYDRLPALIADLVRRRVAVIADSSAIIAVLQREDPHAEEVAAALPADRSPVIAAQLSTSATP